MAWVGKISNSQKTPRWACGLSQLTEPHQKLLCCTSGCITSTSHAGLFDSIKIGHQTSVSNLHPLLAISGSLPQPCSFQQLSPFVAKKCECLFFLMGSVWQAVCVSLRAKIWHRWWGCGTPAETRNILRQWCQVLLWHGCKKTSPSARRPLSVHVLQEEVIIQIMKALLSGCCIKRACGVVDEINVHWSFGPTVDHPKIDQQSAPLWICLHFWENEMKCSWGNVSRDASWWNGGKMKNILKCQNRDKHWNPHRRSKVRQTIWFFGSNWMCSSFSFTKCSQLTQRATKKQSHDRWCRSGLSWCLIPNFIRTDCGLFPNFFGTWAVRNESDDGGAFAVRAHIIEIGIVLKSVIPNERFRIINTVCSSIGVERLLVAGRWGYDGSAVTPPGTVPNDSSQLRIALPLKQSRQIWWFGKTVNSQWKLKWNNKFRSNVYELRISADFLFP